MRRPWAAALLNFRSTSLLFPPRAAPWALSSRIRASQQTGRSSAIDHRGGAPSRALRDAAGGPLAGVKGLMWNLGAPLAPPRPGCASYWKRQQAMRPETATAAATRAAKASSDVNSFALTPRQWCMPPQITNLNRQAPTGSTPLTPGTTCPGRNRAATSPCRARRDT